MNPFAPEFSDLEPEGGGFVVHDRPAYRVVDAGLHGRMPPSDWAKTHKGYMPVITVNPHIMIIMAGAGTFMGHEATVCDLAHKIVLPAIGPGATDPPHIVNLFGELLGVKELPIAHHLYYAAPGERIGNRILILEPESRSHAKGSVLEDRGSLFGLKEITAYGYNLEPVLKPLEHIIQKEHRGTINVDILQNLVTRYMKPTAKNPIILYINACDVSRRKNAEPDPAYLHQMRQPSHGSYPSSITWPKMPSKLGDLRIAVRPAAKHRGVFAQDPHTLELREASNARSRLEIEGIVVGEAPPEMFQVIKEEEEEEEEENNAAAAAAGKEEKEEEEENNAVAAGAGKKRKRNNTCNKKKCPNSKSRKRTASKRASRSLSR